MRFLLPVLLAAACGGSPDPTTTPAAPASEPEATSESPAASEPPPGDGGPPTESLSTTRDPNDLEHGKMGKRMEGLPPSMRGSSKAKIKGPAVDLASEMGSVDNPYRYEDCETLCEIETACHNHLHGPRGDLSECSDNCSSADVAGYKPQLNACVHKAKTCEQFLACWY